MNNTYADIHNLCQMIEEHMKGNSTQEFPESVFSDLIQCGDGNYQFVALDNSKNLQSKTVVVAIGSNYSQGPNQLPKSFGKTMHGPFVEAGLLQWKNTLKRRFKLAREHDGWMDMAFRKRDERVSSGFFIPDVENSHFIMTNFCPWITKRTWRDIRESKNSLSCELLNKWPCPVNYHIKTGTPAWSYHMNLIREKLSGYNVVWVGHGGKDVSDAFSKFVEQSKIDNWAFTANLTLHWHSKGRALF